MFSGGGGGGGGTEASWLLSHPKIIHYTGMYMSSYISVGVTSNNKKIPENLVLSPEYQLGFARILARGKSGGGGGGIQRPPVRLW